ncbi:hypothetical protein [Parachitinimonas caeni]|uniref:Transposase n=1 Tax=Parachitinimonas caeni TaxID=3031301 RepID=A0ABT7E344_9NEIS|nr:hypothetical protein [Parachitinimonas caeni]MDK2126718.1 hypothetical protein [Parachitinimonas caeni]
MVYFGFRAHLNYTGYCAREGRAWSDREKIHSAVNYVVNREKPREVYLKTGDKLVKLQPHEAGYEEQLIIPYKSVDEFMQLNPNCCEITERADEGFQHDLLTRLSGDASGFVRVKYQRRYRGEATPDRHEPRETYVTISNCGTPW